MNDPVAKKHYDSLVKLVEDMRILTEADGLALEKMSFYEARFEEMAELVRKSGYLVSNKGTGMVHINPLLKEMKEMMTHLWRGYREFGFTPSSRASLKTNEKDAAADPWADL